MYIKTNKYQDIEYEKSEEIFLAPEEFGGSFYFDVEEDLTLDDEAMKNVAEALDEVDKMVETAKDFLKEILLDEGNEEYGTVAYFMEYHRDEMDEDTLSEIFPSSDIDTMTFAELVEYLEAVRFGSIIDNKTEEQAFIMDLSFDPELTDELMVIHFNLDKQPYYVAHES